MSATTRIADRFRQLKAENRAALIPFIMAGDPDEAVCWQILAGLPAAGADLIELGMPFSDPMADGPAIQAAGLRALQAGQTLARTLALVRRFRAEVDRTTPIILMGYFNPIAQYAVPRFLTEALDSGVDGLIIVDLPPEEDEELCLPAVAAGMPFIRLATPTTDEQRLPAVLSNASGFLYYVSIAGITGTRSAPEEAVRAAIARFRPHTDLPIGVGFGIRTPKQAAAVAQMADAAVVGSAIIDTVAQQGQAAAPAVHDQVRALAQGVRTARP